mmetsp:Transcript_64687/g.163815  ORF Transcript_64687/g.163815 Transcript_64687/m.163815 type:complete len:365 (-) Transcript_64687:792-1886(-)
MEPRDSAPGVGLLDRKAPVTVFPAPKHKTAERQRPAHRASSCAAVSKNLALLTSRAYMSNSRLRGRQPPLSVLPGGAGAGVGATTPSFCCSLVFCRNLRAGADSAAAGRFSGGVGATSDTSGWEATSRFVSNTRTTRSTPSASLIRTAKRPASASKAKTVPSRPTNSGRARSPTRRTSSPTSKAAVPGPPVPSRAAGTSRFVSNTRTTRSTPSASLIRTAKRPASASKAKTVPSRPTNSGRARSPTRRTSSPTSKAAVLGPPVPSRAARTSSPDFSRLGCDGVWFSAPSCCATSCPMVFFLNLRGGMSAASSAAVASAAVLAPSPLSLLPASPRPGKCGPPLCRTAERNSVPCMNSAPWISSAK